MFGFLDGDGEPFVGEKTLVFPTHSAEKKDSFRDSPWERTVS